MRVGKLIRFDIRFQWRHGFYFVYLLVCAVYAVILLLIPDEYTGKTLVLLTFSDPSALGLIFAGGILLLERGQGIWDSLFITPVKIWEYMLAKCLSLGCLSLAAAFAIHLAAAGWPVSPFSFTLGVLLCSFFFTLLGMAAAVRCRSINAFLMMSQVYCLVFILPIPGYLDWFHTPLDVLLPTQGGLILIDGALRSVPFREASYAVIILVIWIGIASYWTFRVLHSAVKTLDGGKNDA